MGMGRFRHLCLHCSRPLSARHGTKYCSDAHRVVHWRKRQRIGRHFARKPRCQNKRCRKAIAFGNRADAQYCSNRCRQAAFRERQAAKPPKAYQRVVKDQAQTTETIDADISSAHVRLISLATARALIGPFELRRPLPAVARFAFGIFFDDRLVGAVVYGPDYGENLGVWDRYGFDGKIICLSRGACLSWAHPHSASKLIRGSMRLLPEHFKVVTATVDRSDGELGIVYQACGFDYVGVMRPGGRARVSINGHVVSERQAGRIAGTQSARALAQMGFDATTTPRSERYFAFRGSRRERRVLRGAIAHLIKPYPKRAYDV
jgi:hypothetical protein